jgi:hypothetical protein
MTAEQERDLLARQRDRLLSKCREGGKWCPLIRITDVYEAFLVDPQDHWDEGLE